MTAMEQNWWDIVETVSGSAASVIYAVQGQPPPQQTLVREPAVSVGLTGQTGLILVGVAIIAIVFFATRK
jgi:hypothetical protein